jgi:putative hemolysin
MRTTHSLIASAVMVLLISGTFSTLAAQSTEAAADTTHLSMKAYCRSTGGVVEHRIPFFGTNNPRHTWLQLSGSEEFCQYTLADDGSRIHVSLSTLYTKKPTLAALAYYSLTQWNGQGNGNPASFYCTQLGGSDQFGGTNFGGGGWVAFGSNEIDQVLEACVFPDNSVIDSWGLLYHSASIIRGTDLSTVLRYANPFTADKKEAKK